MRRMREVAVVRAPILRGLRRRAAVAIGDCTPAARGQGRNSRRGFSLLEVMLATAILASSAMVLSSLLGLGAKFGGRAEARTEALSQAQSLLAEFLAMPQEASEREQERTGVLPSNPPRAYRIRIVDAKPEASDTSNSAANSSAMSRSASAIPSRSDSFSNTGPSNSKQFPAPAPSRLMLVTVEVFESEQQQEANADQPALCQLSQLVRFPAVAGP